MMRYKIKRVLIMPSAVLVAICWIVLLLSVFFYARSLLRDGFENHRIEQTKNIRTVIANDFMTGNYLRIRGQLSQFVTHSDVDYAVIVDRSGKPLEEIGRYISEDGDGELLLRKRDGHEAVGINNIEENGYYEYPGKEMLYVSSLPISFNNMSEEHFGRVIVVYSLSSLNSQLKQLFMFMVAILALAIIGQIYILTIIAGRITTPLYSLIKSIRSSSRKGGLDFIKVATKVDELVTLQTEYNAMVQNIKKAQAAIKDGAALAAIGSISSHIAHDMRSPLSVLKTYAGLKTTACGDQDVENLRQSAERSVGKLEHMAEDLVDYAKASKLQRVKHQLSGIIYEGSIAEAKKKAEENGVKISSAIQGGIFVNVDAYKLERVITNLVNNAVQAIENPSTELRTGGGEVKVSATTEHNGVLKITVKDNGKGIDPDALPQIFDSFFTKGKKGGSGLGLAYCKQVVEAHGGTIDVESEVGKGTAFTIKIPNCAEEHADALACHSRESGNPETSTPGSPIRALGDDILVDPGSGAGMTAERAGMTMQDKQILIADDDPEIRAQWHKIIPERGGTIVHTAKTIKEVEEAAIDYSKIDTAIVDYQFYGEDKTGIDLIKHLKAKGVKTIYLCTGFYDNEMIINQAHAAGAVRVLPKPIDPTIFS